MIAVSESTPGPIMVNLATYVGSSQAGILGSLLATLAVVLPSFIVILVVMIALQHVIKNKYVQAVLRAKAMYHRHYPCNGYLHGSEIHRCCLSDHRLKCCDHCRGPSGYFINHQAASQETTVPHLNDHSVCCLRYHFVRLSYFNRFNVLNS